MLYGVGSALTDNPIGLLLVAFNSVAIAAIGVIGFRLLRADQRSVEELQPHGPGGGWMTRQPVQPIRHVRNATLPTNPVLPDPTHIPALAVYGGPTAAAKVSRPAARVSGAVKTYGHGGGEVRALDDVSVDFAARRFTAIMGPSGSGKSTLMQCVAGLDTLTSGRVLIGETDLAMLNDRRLTHLRRDRVGFIFQAFNLVPTLTAAENIALPARLAGRKIEPQWLQLVVETVGLADRLDHRPSELSGGQQQRVAVARALAARPEIIFADEPTGNLDSRSGAEVLTFLQRAVAEFGQTIVMVTHDPVAAACADRAIFLSDGRIVDDIENPTADGVLARIHTIGGHR